MVRELPLLLGAIGTVLGFVTLLWLFFLVALSTAFGGLSLESELFAVMWAVSPFLGLAGAFNVKKHGKLGGLLFVAGGTLPWLGISLSGLAAFFWTPLLVFAGILAILNWPGPYVDAEEKDGMAGERSISQS